MSNHEILAVVSRYASAWAGDAKPPTDGEDSASAGALFNITTAPSCSLIPLFRFLDENNKAHSLEMGSSLSHSERVPRPALRCEQCDITAPSEDHFRKHMHGARHKRRIQLTAADAEIEREFAPPA